MKQIIFEVKFFLKEKVKFIIKLPQMLRKTKIYIKKINGIRQNKENIFYFGVPEHPNLGDQAQCMCIENWLKKNYKGHNIIEIPDDVISFNLLSIIKKLKGKVRNDNLIVFQSGYCTTDKYIISEKMHRNIIKNFKNNKILFFPQTVNFASKIEERKTIKIYNNHNNFYFLARDKKSYERAKQMFKTGKIFLFPDIVTSLIGKYDFNNKRDGVLFCLRNDREQFYKSEDINLLKNTLIDKYNINIDEIDTTLKLDGEYIKANIEEILYNEFEKFSSYNLIVTDRYHGTIFSLISATPVIVLGSTDHKLVSGVNWFKDIYRGKIYFAENLNEVGKFIEKIKNDNSINYMKYDDYFDKKYYEKLLNKLEDSDEVNS